MQPGVPPPTLRTRAILDRRAVPIWRAFLLLAGLGAASALPTLGENGTIPLDPTLVQTLRRIETAFRAEDVVALEEVLPRDSRVLLGLESFERRSGYFAPDQVVLIFREIFAQVEVDRFELDLGRASLSRGELFYVPANWSVRKRSSAVKDCQLQFLIRKEGSDYFIREIKEVR